jgi:hypothetical protein
MAKRGVRRSVGRPRQEPEPGERVQLSFRVTPELKRRLDAAATESGRSQSQEAEFRLERSFDRQDLLPQVMSLNYGKELAGVLMLLGTVMIWADAFHRVDNKEPRGPSHKWAWAPDADAYDQSVQGAVAVLEAMRPKGSPIIAQSNAGVEMAHTIIKAVRDDPDAAENGFTDGAPTIRALLGPLVERLRSEKSHDNPFRLALDVLHASAAMERIREREAARGMGVLPKEEVAEVLERHLKMYLVSDWQKRGSHDEGQHNTTGAEVLAFKVRRRA